MTWEVLFSFFVIILMVIGLVTEIARAHVIIFIALVSFFIAGI